MPAFNKRRERFAGRLNNHSKSCTKPHSAIATGATAKLKSLEDENLQLAAAYWGLEKSEVADIKASLEELA